MAVPLILASGSSIRAELLRRAGVIFEVALPRIDEAAIRDSFLAEGAGARDIADALAEMKAHRIAARRPEAMVIGCDQVLEVDGALLSKPASPDEARDQLASLRGKTHRLLSAAVIHHQGAPVWRHVSQARLTMHALSDDWLAAYVARNWDSIRHAVGAYKLEEEGPRLFSRVEGDYFAVLGIPLLELLSYLALRGAIPS